MNYPKLSFKARAILGLINHIGGVICIGHRERHTIFADGIWWDVEEGEACKS